MTTVAERKVARVLRENPIEKYNPFRSTSWRYNRVLELADRQRVLPCAVYDDELVREARDFFILRRAASRGDQLGYNKAICKNPGMHYAFQLFERYDSEARRHIESRLLARQSDAEIAAVSAMLPSGIDIYERLFFNVRDRLTCSDWIVRQAIAPSNDAYQTSDPLKNHELSMKFFAYFAGPVALNAIITGWCGSDFAKDRAELLDLYDYQYKFSLRRKSTTAANSFEVNKYNVMQLFELHQRLMESENANGNDKNKTDIADNILGMLNEIEWTVGSIDVKTHESSGVMQEFDEMAAELRDHEMMALRNGEISASKKAGLKKLKIFDIKKTGDKDDSSDE